MRPLGLGPAGSLARLLLALAVAYGAWQAPGTIRSLQEQARAGEGLTRLERELAPVRGVDVDTRILERARELIPAEAAFSLVTGDAVRVSTPVTFEAFRQFAAYWLLPRRQTLDPTQAEWVVSYGGDLAGLGLRFRRVVVVGEGLAVAEVLR